MALDPITLPTSTALLLGATGARMIPTPRREPTCTASREWGLGLAAGALGLAVVLSVPDAMNSPVGVLGHAALLFGSGLVWSAARRFGGGTAPRPTAAAAGALAWLGMAIVGAPTLGWRIAIGAAMLAAYGFAAAHALLRDRPRGTDARSLGGAVLLVHGAFQGLRAVLGPAFGFAASAAGPSQGWGEVLGLEGVLFTGLFGALAFAMSRERRAGTPRREAFEHGLEDALTGVGNLRALSGPGEALLAEAAAPGRPLALLMMDLDGFKGVNDRHGPAAGDRLLVAFARLAHDYLPPTSLVCRLGGDTFAAMLPGAEPDRAFVVADELRSLFAHLAIEGAGGPVTATVSIGIAQARSGRPASTELFAAADRCLSAAKAAGRNRVVHETELSDDARRSAA